jgi:nicotinamide-nucleotide amidase
MAQVQNHAQAQRGSRASARDLAETALAVLRRKSLSVVTAESCTAGKLAVLLSEVPGAADHLQGGFVVYTKANKSQALGVSGELLNNRGAVCPEVARAMAEGALVRTPADIAVAITGVAGPKPDEDGNPVGLICIAVAQRGRKSEVIERRYGIAPRERIQDCAIAEALTTLLRIAEGMPPAATYTGTEGLARG